MRQVCYTIAALLILAPGLFAQQPPASPMSPQSPIINLNPMPGGQAQPANLLPPFDPKNNRLDALLQQWEQRMSGVDSIICQCSREEKSKTSGFKKLYEGEARYLKPNFVALRMIQKGNPQIYDLYISTGTYLYEYRPQTKALRIHTLEKQANFQNNFLTFLFGMSATDAKKKFDLNLSKEDDNWIYIDILPRFDEDKREFSRAQMVLYTKTMLPRRLWFQGANGDEITWDIPSIDTTTKISEKAFHPPPAPEGWTVDRVPAAGTNPQPPSPNLPQPSKVRPSEK
jgi:TIGR03009 family protein